MKQIRVQFQYTFPYVVTCAVLILTAFVSVQGTAGTILLNGKDVSSSRNQELKNVNVFINERGEVLITAPHYQVLEEQTFIPLSTSGTKAQAPMHQAPREILSAMKDRPKEAVDAPVKSGQPGEESGKIQQPASGIPTNAGAPQSDSEKPSARPATN